MATKTYKSRTCIAINVVMASKKNRHVSFEPCTDGSSSFTTSSPELQEAIEKHYNYKKLFRLESCIEDEKKTADKNTNVNNEITDDVKDIVADDENPDNETSADNVVKVDVSDLEAAKEYLADKFGISRTSLRSKKAIIEQAQAHNIEFVGL